MLVLLVTGPHTEEIRKMLFRFELDNINDKLVDMEVCGLTRRRAVCKQTIIQK